MIVSNCGYGMGPDRFIGQCKSYGQEISNNLAVTAVKSYRKRFKKVVQFWYGMEKTVRNAITRKGRIFHCNKISVKYSGKFLKIRLPSGRILNYYKAHIDKADDSITYFGVDSTTKKFKKLYTYGGKLVENITQGTARDILTHGMSNLQDSKYKVVLHVHDEIVSEIREGKGKIGEYCKRVCRLPEWAKGCPIKAEGWIGKFYRK